MVVHDARRTIWPATLMLKDAAGQELLDHLGDDRPPVSKAVREQVVVDSCELSELVLQEAIQRRGPRTVAPLRTTGYDRSVGL